jgi:hypothetical protein
VTIDPEDVLKALAMLIRDPETERSTIIAAMSASALIKEQAKLIEDMKAVIT